MIWVTLGVFGKHKVRNCCVIATLGLLLWCSCNIVVCGRDTGVLMQPALVTIVVVPREIQYLTPHSLESIYQHTTGAFELVYVDKRFQGCQSMAGSGCHAVRFQVAPTEST